MRILQVITSLNMGGAEKLIVDSIHLYQKKGLKIDLLLLDGTETPLLAELKRTSAVNLSYLSKGSVYSPLHIFRMISYVRKYDIVHVHLFPTLYWAVLAKLLSFSKTKLIYTEHSPQNRRRKFSLSRFTDRLFYSRYDKIIAVSESVNKNLMSFLKLNPGRFQIIHNGINIPCYENAEAYPKEDFFDKGDKLLIQISSFRKEKDQKTIIRSLDHLPENVKLLLVGEGKLKCECEALVQSMGLSHRVKFLGLRMDAERLLKTSDIVILSSQYEGFGLAIAEGMASQKPCIVSKVPELKSIVEGAGLLFDLGDEKALARLIMELIEDEQYYKQVAARCYEAAQKYSIHKMIDKTMLIYQEISDGHVGSSQLIENENQISSKKGKTLSESLL